MKRASEGQLGEALRAMDLESFVYRLPDPKAATGVSNWKPCDFMVWWQVDRSTIDIRGYWPGAKAIVGHAWIEVKDTDAVDVFGRNDIRPSQYAGIREAARLGVPYLLCVYWRRAKRWTISDATGVVAFLDQNSGGIHRSFLQTRFGVDATPSNLAQTLKSMLVDG